MFISTEYNTGYFNNFIKWKGNHRCDPNMVNVTFVQAGYIGATTLIDALLDERASRKGISVRVISSGCKMDEAEAEAAAKIAAPPTYTWPSAPAQGCPAPRR
jgi:F420-dependent methylenetetrahydromethanopterin dehydrogenase